MKCKILFTFFLVCSQLALLAQNTKPQEPLPPFPYQQEEVKVFNQKDSIFLSGRLSYPAEGTNFPAVLLISGSGAQDRNSEIVGHKPFLVISDYLTRAGFAVLSMDDRGSGKSEGDYNSSHLGDLMNDELLALEFLKNHPKIDPHKIGLIGHSLGGVLAPRMALMNSDVSTIVLLAGSGLRGDELMLLQKEQIERKLGVPEAAISSAQQNFRGAYDLIVENKLERDTLKAALENHFDSVFNGMLPAAQLNAIASQLSTPWLSDFIRLDPRDALVQVQCPVLAIIGSNDVQVPAKENFEAIENALIAGGNTEFERHELKGLNHLFQESVSGLPQEYASLEQSFSPVALELIREWLGKHLE